MSFKIHPKKCPHCGYEDFREIPSASFFGPLYNCPNCHILIKRTLSNKKTLLFIFLVTVTTFVALVFFEVKYYWFSALMFFLDIVWCWLIVKSLEYEIHPAGKKAKFGVFEYVLFITGFFATSTLIYLATKQKSWNKVTFGAGAFLFVVYFFYKDFKNRKKAYETVSINSNTKPKPNLANLEILLFISFGIILIILGLKIIGNENGKPLPKMIHDNFDALKHYNEHGPGRSSILSEQYKDIYNK